MNMIAKAAFLAAVLGLGACTNPGRFDNANNVNLNGTGSESDPASPAYFRSTIGDRILFAVDQSTVSESARVVLMAQAGWLAANPEYDALIEGHADEQGTREYNLALGARRANAVQEFLISQGVAPGRIRVVSFGKERPLEICSNESCYTQNRRAVTVISAGGLTS